jgi:hypothetical protein
MEKHSEDDEMASVADEPVPSNEESEDSEEDDSGLVLLGHKMRLDPLGVS